MAIEVPRSEVVQRVVAISPDTQSAGSALAFPVAGQFCLITAAHVLNGMAEGTTSRIHIFKDNNWLTTDATPFYCENGIDIAVVKTPIPAPPESVKPVLGAGGVLLGQDVYFLGFPYFGQSITYGPTAINEGFPLPLIKKGAMSAFNNPEIYIDGHNNPGFSGGPVVFWDHQQNRQKVIGVMSAYLTQVGEVKKIETSITDFYAENSGIAVAYNIKYAIQLINEIYGTTLSENE